MFAKQTGKAIVYGKFEAAFGGFAKSIDSFRANGGCGMNVTAPFKLDAFCYATELSENARLAGAVNSLRFEGDKVLAENFDGIALLRDIVENFNVPIKGKRVLMLGAGGAARGSIVPFLKQSPHSLVIADVSLDAARKLEALFSEFGPICASTYGALVDKKFDLVVNATSASLRGELPPVPASVFDVDCMAYELAYGKGLTPFLRLAKNTGVQRLVDGTGMLVEQGAEAFYWWCGVRPKTREVIAALSLPLV
jgi:shikimate dehydrogenase